MLIAGALMVLGVMLAGSRWDRRWGAPGLVAFGVGLAAARSVEAAPVAAPPAFLTVNAGVLLLGLALVAVGLVRVARTRPDPVTGVGLLSGAAGVAAALDGTVRVALAGGPARAVGIGALIALIAGTVLAFGRRSGIGEALRRRDSGRPGLSPRPIPLIALLAGATALAVGPHLGVVLAGAVLSAWAAWAATAGPAAPRPVAPVLVLLLASLAGWLFATIAGPEGLALRAIPSLPLSRAAEVLIAPLLMAAAWVLAGLWPWRQPLGGVLTAPLGALLVIRAALPAVPAGLEHWRAVAFPVVLAGLWYAALTRRPAALATAGAFLGLASGEAPGVSGTAWLLGCAVAIELLGRVPSAERTGVFRCSEALVALAASWGGLAVLEAGLRTEAVYSVLAALAVVVAVRPERVDPSRSRVHIPASDGKSF